MKIAALIPARAGSKRLPQKNIKLLNGKPLLFWSLDVALECDLFDDVCVSTESIKVAEVVRNHYPESKIRILMRPPELATDTASLQDVCKHYLDSAHEIEYLSLMMPTYPFRNAHRILDEIIPPLYSRQLDRVTSVRYGNFSTFDYWINDGPVYTKLYSGEPLWCGAGNASYIVQKRDYFYLAPHNWPTLLGERTLRIQTNFVESVDIDTIDDFRTAERICAGYRPQQVKLANTEADGLAFVAPLGADLTLFSEYLEAKGIRPELPILILRPADPYFTFLRWHECNSSKTYATEATEKLIARLPSSGHSQDIPLHYIHSPFYRALRKQHDQKGIYDACVPSSQVIFEDDLKSEWPGYKAPVEWSLNLDD